MICLGCGYCCIYYDVIIVKPEAVKPNLTMKKLKDKDLMHKPGFNPCPHLTWKKVEGRNEMMGDAFCEIHHYKWYKHTPCFRYGQIEQNPKSVCRLGEFMIKNKGKDHLKKYCEEFKKTYLSPEEFSEKFSRTDQKLKTWGKP
jgi:Fe-S-cluster containining protein